MSGFGKTVLVALAAMAASTAFAKGTASAPVMEVGMERSWQAYDPAEEAERIQSTWYSLARNHGALKPTMGVNTVLTDADVASISDENATCDTCEVETSRRLTRVAVNKPTNSIFSFSGLSAKKGSHGNGAVTVDADGSIIWTTAVRAKGATAMRVHFDQFTLPENAEMYLYNKAGDVHGPYTALGLFDDGEFWSHTIAGNEAFLEVRLQAPVKKADLEMMRFKVSEIAAFGPNFQLMMDNTEASAAKAFCSWNASCVRDASCYSNSTWASMDSVKAAVAHMIFTSGAYQYICSGGLLNDTVTTSQIPYFLTANHCLSTSKVAKTLNCYFRYRTTSCGASCDTAYTFAGSTVGATLKKTSATCDYTLLQLSQTPPAGSVYLGWNATAVANSNGTQLFRISYPQGSPAAWSTHTVNTSAGTCRTWPRGNWIYSRDTLGATEGGSSGSPVLNAAGQVVGQLSGGCGTNLNNTCDAVNNATVDGAFANYYTAVRQWLAP